MSPTLSCAVMAHPKREAMVADLLERLDRPAEVVWDRVNDRHDTGIRAVKAYDPACTHHLVIQDDALPCADLLAGAERALKWVPQDVPVSLYVGKVRPFAKAVEAAVRRADGASWVTMDGIYWGPAVILPTFLIDEMAAWYLSSRGVRITNYDRRMSTWFQRRQTLCWYSWPSLVDHRGEESLVKPGAGRYAHRFAGETVSALDLDWSGHVAGLTGSEALDRRRQANAIRVPVPA